jgi:prepilin-type N-terminal cleavage/methylation domain-containing protein
MIVSNRNDFRGFTLIELVIIIVVIGIMASIAIPRYQRIDVEARKSGCRMALGSLRDGISAYSMDRVVIVGIFDYPELDTLATIGVVMEHEIPINPFQGETNAPDSIVEGFIKGVVVGDRGGWAYKPSTGEIWPNTHTIIPGSGCAGPTDIGENDW